MVENAVIHKQVIHDRCPNLQTRAQTPRAIGFRLHLGVAMIRTPRLFPGVGCLLLSRRNSHPVLSRGVPARPVSCNLSVYSRRRGGVFRVRLNNTLARAGLEFYWDLRERYLARKYAGAPCRQRRCVVICIGLDNAGNGGSLDIRCNRHSLDKYGSSLCLPLIAHIFLVPSSHRVRSARDHSRHHRLGAALRPRAHRCSFPGRGAGALQGGQRLSCSWVGRNSGALALGGNALSQGEHSSTDDGGIGCLPRHRRLGQHHQLLDGGFRPLDPHTLQHSGTVPHGLGDVLGHEEGALLLG
mmetsp:Transcript_98247/g.262502  ORF Transcript_98247/g.262502 Transcript_98247/m.262502 type:complete len:298 (-) Transcript_98247:160-1053(-)